MGGAKEKESAPNPVCCGRNASYLFASCAGKCVLPFANVPSLIDANTFVGALCVPEDDATVVAPVAEGGIGLN